MTSPCARHACSECCWDTEMPLTEEDAARLAALGHDITAFSRVGDDGARVLRTRDEPRADGKRPCFFLRDGLCSVYADRPAGCRVYPFVLTPEGRMVRDEDCPFRREFRPQPNLRGRLVELVARVQREADARRGSGDSQDFPRESV